MHQLARLDHAVRQAPLPRLRVSGIITEATAGAYSVAGISRFVALGDHVRLSTPGHEQLAEVIRIDDERVTVKAFEGRANASLGTRVHVDGPRLLRPDPGWRGRVIDALGRPIDGAGALIAGERAVSTEQGPPAPMRRARIGASARSGVRAIDLFTPLCLGQRVGIFAGSGVGKSSLLAMLARSPGFDTVVIALVGERGREVREFIEDTLGATLGSAVVVVSTSDESPMMRRQAAKTAMTVAEHLRDLGQKVLLIVDSITRYAHAVREVALAAGEPPVARGYTPSVFSELPKLLERAGPGETGTGSITGIFSVLVDGDDHNDPVADAIRGTLDGHIVLDRAIADQGRYPAIDVVSSISRLARRVWTADQRVLLTRVRGLIARYEDTRDLRMMGGHKPGADAELDCAVALVPTIYHALEQDLDAPPSDDAFRELSDLLQQAKGAPAGS
ncbi:MAG TPA: flagellar protein export ATPase FliI [Paracoccaceae bacterium]|nr:flagellar protein export ATPase FliI [Paracoccaceae bacterium]